MSYEIIGESIKSATSIKLGQIFNNPIRYKENITNPQYPNFSIVQVDMNITPQQSIRQSVLNKPIKRLQIDYLMNIQYRVAENTEEVSNLQQQLDAVGLKLLAEFDELQLELPTKIKGARYEKADGVLQFFYNITVYVNPSFDTEDTMQDLSLDEDIIKEEEE